jgi:hypothetical protein
MRCLAQKDAYCYRVFAGILSPKIEKYAILSIVKEWKKSRTKYTENYISKIATSYIAANKIMELIPPFVLVFRRVYCVLKNIKSISGL